MLSLKKALLVVALVLLLPICCGLNARVVRAVEKTGEYSHTVFGIDAGETFVINIYGTPITVTAISDTMWCESGEEPCDWGYITFSLPDTGMICMNQADGTGTEEVYDVFNDTVNCHKLEVFNVAGRLIYSQDLTAKEFNNYVWLGYDDLGRYVARGVYFIKCGNLAKKIVILK